MLVRYNKTPDGKLVKQAEVYTKEEHGIALDQIDPDALFITRKLRSAGFEAYIVGGAVRDLLLGRKPKDFDIVTDAHPRAIKKVLPFSRIIGKRFRLVHVYFPGDKIFEVATFRSNVAGDNNVFGTLEEDAKRRDFTMNALYYAPHDQHIIDQVGGFKDIKARRLHNVIDLKNIFDEDPVRMIRAVKYATSSGFRIPSPLAGEIKKKAPLLAQISPARLTEEFFKILHSGLSEKIFLQLAKYRLLHAVLPGLAPFFAAGLFKAPSEIQLGLRLLDKEIGQGKTPDRSEALTFIIAPWLETSGWHKKADTDSFETIIQELKRLFQPIIPSNQELENSLRGLFRVWAVRSPRRRPRRPPRRRKPQGSSPAKNDQVTL